jgi:hypothetical protein
MTNGRWWALLTLIVVLTLARVATTHRVFAQTIDEGAHLLAGYDALTKGVFTTDRMHPPLPRMLFALPFINEPQPRVYPGYHELLLRDGRYTQNLARARRGNLVFLALGIVAVALWGRRLVSPNAGLLAALLYASLPPVLAHAGLATTDMAAGATLPLALYALMTMLDRSGAAGFSPPTFFGGLKAAAPLAAAMALGMLCKYSFVVYFPACAVVLLVLRRRLPWKELLVAGVLAGVIVSVVMPGAYVAGVLEVMYKNADPPKAILFGEVRTGGWWYYFPVVLFFKTPIPFLVLALLGLRQREAALVAAAILAISMTSDINIGVRHLLPIYAPLAVLAASIRVRWLTIAMTAWLIIGSALAHPDYLAWFNAFAGREPYRVLNDSNLDWGQDLLRLVRVARDERIPFLTISVLTAAPVDQLGLPPHTELQLLQPVHGWLAISEYHLAISRSRSPEVRRWLDDLLRDRPYRRVGKSIRLYSVQ